MLLNTDEGNKELKFRVCLQPKHIAVQTKTFKLAKLGQADHRNTHCVKSEAG